MHSSYKTLLLFICSFLLMPLALASSEDTQQPITIEADRAELDEKKQRSIYTGNVILKQGGIEVKANRVTVYTNKDQLQRITAEGNPIQYRQHRDKQDDIRGTSQRMEYETESKRLLLLDNAELWQGKNRFSGERIQYDPKEEKVIATGDPNGAKQGAQRVQIILQPRSESREQNNQTQEQKNQAPQKEAYE